MGTNTRPSGPDGMPLNDDGSRGFPTAKTSELWRRRDALRFGRADYDAEEYALLQAACEEIGEWNVRLVKFYLNRRRQA